MIYIFLCLQIFTFCTYILCFLNILVGHYSSYIRNFIVSLYRLRQFLILYEYRDRYNMFECVDEESGDITKRQNLKITFLFIEGDIYISVCTCLYMDDKTTVLHIQHQLTLYTCMERKSLFILYTNDRVIWVTQWTMCLLFRKKK